MFYAYSTFSCSLFGIEQVNFNMILKWVNFQATNLGVIRKCPTIIKLHFNQERSDFRYPCAGHARGGTCQSLPGTTCLPMFWAYNSVAVAVFHFFWKPPRAIDRLELSKYRSEPDIYQSVANNPSKKPLSLDSALALDPSRVPPVAYQCVQLAMKCVKKPDWQWKCWVQLSKT